MRTHRRHVQTRLAVCVSHVVPCFHRIFPACSLLSISVVCSQDLMVGCICRLNTVRTKCLVTHSHACVIFNVWSQVDMQLWDQINHFVRISGQQNDGTAQQSQSLASLNDMDLLYSLRRLCFAIFFFFRPSTYMGRSVLYTAQLH